MFSLVHTPISEVEALWCLELSQCKLRHAISCGTPQKSYRDPTDPESRIKHQNVSDLIYIMILSSMDWPMGSISAYEEDAEYAFEIFAEAWENQLDIAATHKLLSDDHEQAGFITLVVKQLRNSIDLTLCINDEGRSTLLKLLETSLSRISQVVRTEFNCHSLQFGNIEIISDTSAPNSISKGDPSKSSATA